MKIWFWPWGRLRLLCRKSEIANICMLLYVIVILILSLSINSERYKIFPLAVFHLTGKCPVIHLLAELIQSLKSYIKSYVEFIRMSLLYFPLKASKQTPCEIIFSINSTYKIIIDKCILITGGTPIEGQDLSTDWQPHVYLSADRVKKLSAIIATCGQRSTPLPADKGVRSCCKG